MLRAKQTIRQLTHILIDHLNELYKCDSSQKNAFVEGEKTAFVECLEIIQHFDSSTPELSFNIEEVYPLA